MILIILSEIRVIWVRSLPCPWTNLCMTQPSMLLEKNWQWKSMPAERTESPHLKNFPTRLRHSLSCQLWPCSPPPGVLLQAFAPACNAPATAIHDPHSLQDLLQLLFPRSLHRKPSPPLGFPVALRIHITLLSPFHIEVVNSTWWETPVCVNCPSYLGA